MGLNLGLLLFLSVLLNVLSISYARAGGSIDPETIPYLLSANETDTNDYSYNSTETTEPNLNDLDYQSPEETCSSDSSLPFKCAWRKRGELLNVQNTSIVKELLENFVETVKEQSNNSTENSEAPSRSSSRFNINIDTILDTFHDVYRYYLPIPPSIAIHDHSVNNGGSNSHDSSPDSGFDEFATMLGAEDAEARRFGEGFSSEHDADNEITPPSLSLECENDVLAIYRVFNRTDSVDDSRAMTAAALLEKIWPLRIMDSWGKSEDGILVGNLHRIGFMQECLDTNSGEAIGISGQYCLIKPEKIGNHSLAGLLPALYGTCIPSSCTSEELQASLDYQLAPLLHKTKSVSCQQKDEPMHFGTWEICGCTCIGVMVLMVVASTFVDIIAKIRKEKCRFIIKAFSAIENMTKIWEVKNNVPGEISCLYGIRVLSISWIILGHHYAYLITYGVNQAELAKMTSGWAFQMVWSGYKAVDTFFTISGVLLVKGLLKENFCLKRKTDLEAGPNTVASSTLTLVRNSPKSSEKSLVPEQVEDSTTQEASSVGVKGDYIDSIMWHKLVRQGFSKSATYFLFRYGAFILQRFARLFPTMLIIVMYCAGPSSYFISGPYKSLYQSEYMRGCRENWWVDLTFFSNIIFVVSGLQQEKNPTVDKPVDSCISHSWYIAVDWQLQLILPLLILPCKILRHKGTYLMCLIAVFSVIPGLVVIGLDLMPAMLITIDYQASLDYTRAIYMMPYARAAPYLVGGLCGLLLYQAESDVRTFPKWLTHLQRKGVQFTGWLLFVASTLAIVFGLAETNIVHSARQLNAFEKFMYASFASTAWSICVGWIVVTCTLGLAGPINHFLSHPMWQPLSRVSYSVYLISLPIQKMVFYSFQRDIYLTHTTVVLSCCGVVALSFLVSFGISVVAESPFIKIAKHKREKSKKTKSTSPESTSPESTGPESTGPESTGPESTSPESTSPESTNPESTSPESTSTESTSPKSTRKET